MRILFVWIFQRKNSLYYKVSYKGDGVLDNKLE